MVTRWLGKEGCIVSALGLGCMGMSEFYGQGDEKEAVRTIHRAVESGCTFLDTADMYGTGSNERLVGRALEGLRDKVVLATKFGIVRDEQGRVVGVDGRPEHARACCEASLKRLGVDMIDLYYLHRVDPQVPIQETVGAMADLVREGKVRYLGLSEAAPQTLRNAASVHPITALQTEYSIITRDVEERILPACRELGIGFVAYSPLGRGFLSGKIRTLDDLEEGDWRRRSPRFEGDHFRQNLTLDDLEEGDWRRRSPRFEGDHFRQNLALVRKLEEIAASKGCTPAQLALAWLLAQGEDIVPIPGAKSRGHLEENMGALAIKLTEEDLRNIDKRAPKGAAAGQRYSEEGMKAVNR